MYKLRLGQSYLSLGAFVCYAITLLFFIICFCSNHWWYFRLDGKVINMGLWTGCWQSDSGQTECSKAIFDNKVFKTGGGSDWYHGTRILMTCALIAIFLQEFALIGFLCINELDRYRQKLAGAVLGFSFVTVLFMALVLAMISTEAAKLDMGHVGWSFHLAGVNVIPCTCVVTSSYLELYHRKHGQLCFTFRV
ncbi:uncharacterized protein LOC111121479 isoform X5 [Crassostrea virginica]|uniref:Uncharacterized protein LOC111121479 isoform X2 n=1 Tax=Crassostrea virginica TaxID=6565 RepID=A0A8B8CRM3_CRAVI|nr:uncharacterized protein LOC111121479 isoform X2 [Crassostrea virginica]